MEAWRWRVSGLVQGVGFRWFVLNQATRLGLAGWVENLPDGAVEVVAKGSVNQLTEMERELRRGPRFSHVEHVERVDFPHEVGGVKGFEIK
jgi:acylphosphatase